MVRRSIPDSDTDSSVRGKPPARPGAQTGTAPLPPCPPRADFGTPAMRALFNFAPGYTPLNHGSYGTFPRYVLEYREQLLRDFEARPDIYKRFVYPRLLREARGAVAPLLGAHRDEVVFVTNATTGVNVVMRNLRWEEGDVVLHPSSVYAACLKTVQSVGELLPVEAVGFEVKYPIEDDELVARFRKAVDEVRSKGKRVKLALFDTIVSGPGVRVPWETLVDVCKELGILSLVDGAHGIGHIDLMHVGKVSPDFLVSNCHKWLFAPRGCAVFYVPFRNHHLITTSLPTSHGYRRPSQRPNQEGRLATDYFTELFVDVATTDNSPYTSLPAALKFRNEVCGGEDAIRDYCFNLAKEAGARVAEILGTEVMKNESGSINQCCLFNVRLPLNDVTPEKAPFALMWLQETAATEADTYIQVLLLGDLDGLWVRFSAQVYLSVADFEWGAKLLLGLCDRIKDGSYEKDIASW